MCGQPAPPYLDARAGARSRQVIQNLRIRLAIGRNRRAPVGTGGEARGIISGGVTAATAASEGWHGAYHVAALNRRGSRGAGAYSRLPFSIT
jgi:hypothetical protein